MKLLEELRTVLKQDERLVSEDKLLKNRIVELALKLDKDLLKLLLGNKKIKGHFFAEVDKTLIFDKEKFMQFIDNKEFLPDSYTAFKNKIGLTADRRYLAESKEVVLSWPYKDCILEGGQEKEDEKRKEIFHNEILAPDEIDILLEPKVFTNFKRIDAKGEHKDSEIKPTDNLIIKGNNLLVLHSLMKRFSAKVKLIYIDPPFNIGNDEFQYNDNFNHSTWLTFMRNRLEIAKELLSSDGSIYVHLDFNEVHYCKVLMDEIFGRENFQREIIWRMGWVSGYKTMAKNWIRNHDNILFYVKNQESFTFNKKYLPYPKDYERWGGREKGQGLAIEDIWGIHVGEGINSLAVVSFAKEYTGFRTQKPETLLKRIIEASTNEGDIVLDFCLGTGTTAVVAHKIKRQYIGIEQLDYGKKDAFNRLKKVIKGDQSGISKDVNWKGGGDFVCCELKELNEAFVKKIMNAKNRKEILKIWEEAKQNGFLSYRIAAKLFDKNFDEFKALTLEEQQLLLIECLESNYLYVNYSEMEDTQYKVSKEDVELNKNFYGDI